MGSAAKKNSSDRSTWDLPGWAFITLALCLPIGLLAIHRTYGHQGDLGFFFDWFRAFATSNAFYRDGPGINYPILGVLWLSLPAWLVETIRGESLRFEEYRDIVKLTLVAAEALLIVVVAHLAQSLRLRRPRLLAMAIYLLPSTWGMGAWFGQIDVVGSLLLLTVALGAIRYSHRSVGGKLGVGWLVLGLAGLHGAILTKQLTLFSVPGLFLMLGASIAFHRARNVSRRWWTAAIALSLASPVIWFVADPWLSLPDGYWSHLHFVLAGGGSDHGDLLCGSGANLWGAIYPPEIASSSRETLLIGIPIRTWGIALFGIVELVLLIGIGLIVQQRLHRDEPLVERIRSIMGLGVLFVGVSNLAMATVLTGVHERYLVHGIPFLIVGLASEVRRSRSALRPFPRLLFYGAWLVGAWSGLFALATLHWRIFSMGPLIVFQSNEATAALQLALLIASMTLVLHRAALQRGR